MATAESGEAKRRGPGLTPIGATGSIDDRASLAGIHILVVEDHGDTRDLWERVLEYSGAFVTAASSAREAVQFCASLRPDVILTDLSMPDEDGVWLAEQLRAQDERLPIIAVSGYTRIFGDRLQATRFTRILQKPIDPWQLVAVVAAVAR